MWFIPIMGSEFLFFSLLILEKCILTEISRGNSMSGTGKRQQTVCGWLSVTCVFLRTKVWHSCRIYWLTWPRSRWVGERRVSEGQKYPFDATCLKTNSSLFFKAEEKFSFFYSCEISHECLMGRFFTWVSKSNWFWIVTLWVGHDWRKKLAPLSHPIRSKTKPITSGLYAFSRA